MKNNNSLTLFVLLFGLFSLGLRAQSTPQTPSVLINKATGNLVTFDEGKHIITAGGGIESQPEFVVLKKERDDLKAQNAQQSLQIQQLQFAAEYYKALHDRNEALGVLGATQKQLEAANAKIDQLQAELAALKKPAPSAPEAKK